ncbi:hypothetical protein GWI33_007505 [Rhynchophorus ferrugineus]|uniref:Uncharacterized protein n=1 Tax=Rhynchophorus ferrugineus TaxID=354439 RepID=A0A834MD03_RHYFE|nr:hypothetical protein GWI33_007505 [Rhynchophorus ferrugineus]
MILRPLDQYVHITLLLRTFLLLLIPFRLNHIMFSPPPRPVTPSPTSPPPHNPLPPSQTLAFGPRCLLTLPPPPPSPSLPTRPSCDSLRPSPPIRKKNKTRSKGKGIFSYPVLSVKACAG